MKKSFMLAAAAAILLPFASCNKDAEKSLDVTIHHGEDFALTEEFQGLDWNSENDFVAYVQDNKVIGQYVGETVIKSADGKSELNVVLAPQYKYYDEPINDFGKSINQVVNTYGDPAFTYDDEGQLVYIYESSNTFAPYVYFTFEDGKVVISAVDVELANGAKLVNFLSERYVVMNNQEGNILYAHMYGSLAKPSVDMKVEQEFDDEEWTVYYALHTETRSTVNNAKEAIKKAKAEFLK